MRADTNAVHDALQTLGSRLGLIATREQGASAFANRLEGEYAPRPDVLWSLPLTGKQRAALARVTGRQIGDEGLPLTPRREACAEIRATGAAFRHCRAAAPAHHGHAERLAPELGRRTEPARYGAQLREQHPVPQLVGNPTRSLDAAAERTRLRRGEDIYVA